MSILFRILGGFGLVMLSACGADPAPSSSQASPSLEPLLGLEGNLDIAGGTAHIPVMKEAAKRLEFEEAARLRDRIRELRRQQIFKT